MESGSSVSTWEEIRKAILAINWDDYETAYGNAAEDIPYYISIGDSRGCTPKVACSLMDLFSDDEKTALQASHDLWCGLCHQHAYVSSAALPAFDILFYGLINLSDPLKVEILDIFYGFAVCTSCGSLNTWQGRLRSKLEEKRSYFQSLMKYQNEDIRSFAELIVEELGRAAP